MKTYQNISSTRYYKLLLYENIRTCGIIAVFVPFFSKYK